MQRPSKHRTRKLRPVHKRRASVEAVDLEVCAQRFVAGSRPGASVREVQLAIRAFYDLRAAKSSTEQRSVAVTLAPHLSDMTPQFRGDGLFLTARAGVRALPVRS